MKTKQNAAQLPKTTVDLMVACCDPVSNGHRPRPFSSGCSECQDQSSCVSVQSWYRQPSTCTSHITVLRPGRSKAPRPETIAAAWTSVNHSECLLLSHVDSNSSESFFQVQHHGCCQESLGWQWKFLGVIA